VFKVDSSGSQTVLHIFSFTDGACPYAPLIRDADGNLYGTTLQGGAFGYGTVFKLDPSSKETVLHSFAEGTLDGYYPSAGLLRDEAGNLYGTTENGGASEYGTVFKLDTGSDGMSATLRQQFASRLLPQVLQHVQLLVELLGSPAGSGFGNFLQPLPPMASVVNVPAGTRDRPATVQGLQSIHHTRKIFDHGEITSGQLAQHAYPGFAVVPRYCPV